MNDIERAWSVIAHQIDQYRANKDISVSEIDHAVSVLGDFVWELGPYLDTDQLGFALSPGWDRQLLALAESAIDAAPRIEGVIILAAKPPKKWMGHFQLDTDNGLVDVYAHDIGFRLVKHTESEAEIIIELEPSLESWKGDIVNIWIDSEIGEYNKITHIPWCNIKLSQGNKSGPFELRRNFFSYFPRARYAVAALRLVSGELGS